MLSIFREFWKTLKFWEFPVGGHGLTVTGISKMSNICCHCSRTFEDGPQIFHVIPRLSSVALVRFGYAFGVGTVRTVLVFGSGGSSAEVFS